MGGAHHFPLVGAPGCLDFGVGPRADGLPQRVEELFGTRDVALEGVGHQRRTGPAGRVSG